MAQTSTGSLVSPGALLFGVLIGAFATVLAVVGTYTFDVKLTGKLIGIYLVVGLVVAVAAAAALARSD